MSVVLDHRVRRRLGSQAWFATLPRGARCSGQMDHDALETDVVASFALKRPVVLTARLLMVVLALVSWSIWPAAAALAKSSSTARAAQPRVLVLRPAFQPVRVGVYSVWTSGDYLLSTIANGVTQAPTVINERTGRSTLIDIPGCYVDGLGDPWLLIECKQIPNSTYLPELYSLADGARRTVTPNPSLPYGSKCPPGPDSACAYPDAVGTHWIRFDSSCYHCGDSFSFQSIQTGQLSSDPTNATTFADLNSPTLAHKTCSQVRVLPWFEDFAPVIWGSLTFHGPFALANGMDRQGNGGAYLERCGSHLHRLLASGPYPGWAPTLASNSHVIVWQTTPRQLSGLFLPSLQTFVIPLPASIVNPSGLDPHDRVWALALTSRSLYVLNSALGQLWKTPSPTQPPPLAKPIDTKRPSLTRSGNTLTCKRGTWRNASRYSYGWLVNGRAKKGASKPNLAVTKGLKRHNVACTVTASNAAGHTTASSAAFHVR
jgi:hypothetical protein